jgi:putative flippase GtrA
VARFLPATAWARRGLALQYARFAGVGAIATGAHVVLFVGLIELLQISAVIANLAAFGAALLLSFVGHCRWTFRLQDDHWRALGRFTAVALIGLALNSAIAYGIADRLDWHYAYAVAAMVTATPVALFLLSRYWAFAGGRASRPPREAEYREPGEPVEPQQADALKRMQRGERRVDQHG